MRLKSFAEMRCPIARALDVLGDRWTLLLVRELSLGISRYEDFRSGIAIPDATLAGRLKNLTSNGIVERVRYQEKPPRYEYKLTSKGADLWKVSLALREWGDAWATGLDAPTLEPVDARTGRSLRLALIDPDTDMRVPEEHVLLRAGPHADEALRNRIDLADGGRLK